MIMIQPGADMRGGVRQDASAMETLKLQDYEDIVNETRYVSMAEASWRTPPRMSAPGWIMIMFEPISLICACILRFEP